VRHVAIVYTVASSPSKTNKQLVLKLGSSKKWLEHSDCSETRIVLVDSYRTQTCRTQKFELVMISFITRDTCYNGVAFIFLFSECKQHLNRRKCRYDHPIGLSNVHICHSDNDDNDPTLLCNSIGFIIGEKTKFRSSEYIVFMYVNYPSFFRFLISANATAEKQLGLSLLSLSSSFLRRL
jgi:hypothetical protein